MFNHSMDRPARANDYDDDPFGFGHQPWPPNKFSVNPQQQHQQQQSHGHAPRQSFSSVSAMDWAPTPSDDHNHQHHHQHNTFHHGFDDSAMTSGDNVQLDDMSNSQGGGGGVGVGRLVAHFENKQEYVPPLPPRPINTNNHLQNLNHDPHATSHSHMSNSASTASHFGSLNVAAHNNIHTNRETSPMNSPNDSYFGSFGTAHSRVASPMGASPPAMNFGSFHDNSRVSSPMAGPSSEPFGSLDDFMAVNRVHSPLVPSPMITSPMVPTPMATSSMATSSNQTTPAVGGTPGFSIWRPPASMTPKPTQPRPQPQSQNQQSRDQNQVSNQMNSAGYFKPPVPTTPKPVMNIGSQFILEFNPNSKAKGKAPAKPPRPRIAMPPPPTFSPELKQEPPTPQPFDAMATLSDAQGSTSLSNQSGTRPSREQVPAESWEQYKTTIRTLYLEERKPLKEVMSVMADKYGFQATPKMYKTRFSAWGFVKNNTEDEVKRLLSMKFQRDAEGKVSEFVRNGKVVNLGTYLKRKGVTEYDLVDFELPANLPDHIRCRTPTPPPTPGYLRSPDLLRAQELVIGNMRKAFLHCRQFEVETDTQIGWPMTMVWGAGSSDLLLEANFYFEARDADQGGHFLMRAFKQLELDLKKLTPQGITEVLLGMVNRDPGMMTALCKYLAAHSSTNLERSHPLRQIFTCLYEVQQKHGSVTLSELLWGSTPTIAEELEAIYGRKHPYIARTWVDLALFYNHANPERMEKLVAELRPVQRQVEQRHGTGSVDALAVRYAILQLLYLANPQSDATKRAANEMWNDARSMNLVFPVRDSRPDVYCYHSPLKVDPWTKRCRRRYDSGVSIIEELVGVKVHAYFEEDFHMLEHAAEQLPDAQDSWAAAMQQDIGMNKWGFL